MNRLKLDKRCSIIKCLVEGNSIRSTARLVGVSKDTVLKLLVDIGKVCAAYQCNHLTHLPCTKIQVDEIWCFCSAKQRNVPFHKRNSVNYGDVWTWTALCPETKLIVSWHIGKREQEDANIFMSDVASRFVNKIQISTDGFTAYPDAVHKAFEPGMVSHGVLIKTYGKLIEKNERRYSPYGCTKAEKQFFIGNPNPKNVSTSLVERQNLTMRMSMRRFTRLTNAFSKKVENLGYAVALHFMYYNFCRIHQTIKVTPAMKAGVTDHVWSIEEILSLIQA